MLLAYLHDWRISLSIAISRSLAKGAYIGAYFPTVLDLLASRYVLSLSIKFVSNWFKCPLKLSSSFVYSPSSKHQISSQSLQTPVKPSFLPSPSLTEKKSHLLFLFSLSILLVPRSQPINEDDDPICIQPAISLWQPTSDSHVQWIGLREHLQETVVFTCKILEICCACLQKFPFNHWWGALFKLMNPNLGIRTYKLLNADNTYKPIRLCAS